MDGGAWLGMAAGLLRGPQTGAGADALEGVDAMTVYVDSLVGHPDPKDPQARRAGARHGQRWCHLFTDSADCADLHAMAAKIGLKRAWFQNEAGKLPHYDLVPPRRAAAAALGAVECGRAKLVECIHAARARATKP